MAALALLCAAPLFAAEVTLDATASGNSGAFNGTAPSVVFLDDLIGYAFYLEAAGSAAYVKTVDGGVNWGNNSPLFNNQTGVTVETAPAQIDLANLAVWYDRWTPGDTTGTYIHIATIDTGADDVWYTRLDTTSDTLSTTISVNALLGLNGTLVSGVNMVSLCKGTSGSIYAGVLDGGGAGSASYVAICPAGSDPTVAANWSEAGAATKPFSNDPDWPCLMPLAGDNLLLIRWDLSASTMDSAVYTKATNTWSGLTTIDAAVTLHTGYGGAFGATVDRVTNKIYLAYAADTGPNDAALGVNDDLRVAVYTGGAWDTTKPPALLDDTRGITGVKVAYDEYNNSVWVVFTAQVAPPTATSAYVYAMESTDGMSSWGAEVGPLNAAAGNIYGARVNLMADERLFATWVPRGPDALRGAVVVDILVPKTKYWIGAGAGNFNDDTRWSLSSGGLNNTTAPGVVGLATFDGNGTGNCTITAAANVIGIDLQAGYPGTLTLNAAIPLTVGASGFVQSGGTFTAAAAGSTIDVNGAVNLTGGTFTATAGAITASGNVSVAGGVTFNANGGTLTFDGSGTQTFTTGAQAYNHVTVNQATPVATVDGAVNTTATRHNGSSSTTVFISATVGYAFYIDSNGTCVYRKTTDGGSSWTAGFGIVHSLTDLVKVAVWYDRWTPGDSTGTYIHVATLDDGANDDVWYTRFNTSGDTASATVSVAMQNSSIVATENTISICKDTGGTIYAGVLDGGGGSNSYVARTKVAPSNDPTVAGNWIEAGTLSGTAANNDIDWILLLPLASETVMLIRYDVSGSLLDSNIYTKTGDTGTWAGFTTIASGITVNITYDGAFGATLNRATNNLYLVCTADTGTLGTDDDLRTWVYSGGAWSAKTNVATNSVAAGVGNAGIVDAKIAFDEASGDIYVLYIARTTPGTATTGNVYWKKSSDDMTSWTAEQGPLNTAAGDLYGARLNLIPSSGLVYATWVDTWTDPDELYGYPLTLTSNKVTISGNLDVNGTLTVAGGTLDCATNNPAVNTAGNVTVSLGAVVSAGIGLWTFDGAGSATLSGNNQNFGTALIDGTTKTVVLGSAATFTTLTIGLDDVYDLAGYATTITTLNNNNRLRLLGSESVAITTFDVDSGTTEYYGTGVYASLVAGANYYSLHFNGTGSWAQTVALDVNGNLTIDAGTLNSAGFGITLAGNWDNDATYTSGANTVTFDGTTAVTGTSTTTFRNIVISGTLTGHSGTMNVAGNWTNNGTFTHNSGTVDFTTATAVAGTSTTTFNNVTISGTLTGHSGTMNVAGLWTDNGTFTHNSGTVAFTGTGTYAGTSNSAFSTLSVTGTLTLDGTDAPTATTASISGTLTLNGSAAPTITTLTVASGGSVAVNATAVPTITTMTVQSGGSVAVNATAVLTVDLPTIQSGGALTVNDTGTLAFDTFAVDLGGTLTLFGTSTAAPAVLRGKDGVFTLTVAGAIDAQNFSVYDAASTGKGGTFVFAAGSTVSMRGGRFRTHPGGATAYLNFNAYNGANLQLADLRFDNIEWVTNPYNVRASAIAGVHVILTRYGGRFGGERYEYDLNGRVHWYPTTPRRQSSVGPTDYEDLIAALEASGSSGTVTVWDNVPFLGNLVLDGTTLPTATAVVLERALIVGDVTLNKAGLTVDLINCMIVGTVNVTAGTLNIRHCSISGSATATSALYCLVGGTLTAGVITECIPPGGIGPGPSVFADAARWDLHLALGDPAGAMEGATTSSDPFDFDGGARPIGGFPDIGADEADSLNGVNDLLWDFATVNPTLKLGPITALYRFAPARLLLVCTGTRAGNADTAMFENALVILDMGTGAVVAGLCGAGTPRAAGPGNIAAPNNATFYLPGAAEQVLAWHDYDDPNNRLWRLQLTMDSNGDGRTETIRRYNVPLTTITLPGSASNRPNWSNPAAGWSWSTDFTLAGGGPLSTTPGFGIAAPYHIFIGTDNDGAGARRLYRIDATDGVNPNVSALTISNALYPVAAESGVVTYSNNEFFTGLAATGTPADNDLIRFDTTLTGTQFAAVTDAGGTNVDGLTLKPRAGYFGQTNLMVATPDQYLRRYDITLGLFDAGFGTAGYVSLETDGVSTAASGTALLASPGLLFGMSYYLAPYTTDAGGSYLTKLNAANGAAADLDWKTAGPDPRTPLRGTILPSPLLTPYRTRVMAATDEGWVYHLKFNNLGTGAADEGELAPGGAHADGHPLRIPGRGLVGASFDTSFLDWKVFVATPDGTVRAYDVFP